MGDTIRHRLTSIAIAIALVLPSVVVLTATPAAASTTFSNAGSIALNDPNTAPNTNNNANASPYPSSIAVSGLVGTVSHLTVTLSNTTYQYSQDIDALLVGPGGQTLILVSNLGPNSGAAKGASGSTLTLDDAGVLPPSGMPTPWGTASTFKPVNYGGFNQVWVSPAPRAPYGDPGTTGAGATLGSVFNGASPNGTWSLYVITTAGGDGTGAIAGGWSLNVTTASAAPSTTTVSSSSNPSFSATPGNSVTLTAAVERTSDTSAVNEGTVTFKDGGVAISGCGAQAVAAGTAICSTSFATEGAHAITAQFNGTASFGPSSAALTQLVDKHTTVTGSSYCNTGGVTLNNPPNTVADATPYPSHVFVSGLAASLSHLTVSLLNTTYSHSQDIDALLVGPGGQTLILVSNLGPNSGAGAPASGSTLTLDDAGTLPPSGMVTPWGAASTFKPVNYGGFNQVWGPPAPSGPYGNPGAAGTGATLGSVFNGTSPNGTWSLYVITTASGDGTGAIAGGWCANITAAAIPTTTTTVASSSNPSFTAAPGNSVTLTATVKKTSDMSAVSEGSVAFADGGTTIAGCGAQSVAAGTATCSTSFATEGAHAITAQFNGTANVGSSSAALTQLADRHTTVTGSSYCNTGGVTLNNPPNTVADASPYPSHVFVSGKSGSLTHLTVSLLNTTYSHSQDIDALLVGPGGQSLILVSNLGPNSGPGVPASGSTLTLDDAGILPAAGALTQWGSNSTFKPVNYGGFNQVWGPPAPSGPYGDPGTAGTGATLGSAFKGASPNGTWSLYVITTASGDGTGAIAGGWCLGVTSATAGDVDGDHRTDLSVYRPSTGTWYVSNSGGAPYSQIPWGQTSDIPVPADYGGTGKSQVAIYRPSTAQWFVRHADGTYTVTTWGSPGGGDIPVPADYEGVGKADIAIFRPSTGQWFILKQDGSYTATTWGAPGGTDIPVPAGYDGTGKAQLAIFRPTTGQWYVLHADGGNTITTWGASGGGDIPVPGDYQGVGKADLAVFRRSTGEWIVLKQDGSYTATVWGAPGSNDIPQPGDYTGDGKTDLTVYRPGSTGTWYVLPSGGGAYTATGWGATGDVPTVLPDAIGHAFFPALYP